MVPDTARGSPFRRLSAGEAARALYIDFEGEKDKAPVFLGVLRHAGRGPTPFVHQEVMDPTFANIGLRTTSLRECVENVVRRAERSDRRIVSWSQHDLKVVRTLGEDDPGLVARFESRYANALSVERHWANKLHREVRPRRGRLADYLVLIEYVVPSEASAGHVGATIRILRPRLEDGRPLTDRQREHWVLLVEHNRHDCAGMGHLCLRATRELEGTNIPVRPTA